MALFGFTAKAWREANPELAKKNNVRDFATINELTVLSNLESHNAQMMKKALASLVFNLLKMRKTDDIIKMVIIKQEDF